jgi:type III secretory pathway component EscT
MSSIDSQGSAGIVMTLLLIENVLLILERFAEQLTTHARQEARWSAENAAAFCTLPTAACYRAEVRIKSIP